MFTRKLATITALCAIKVLSPVYSIYEEESYLIRSGARSRGGKVLCLGVDNLNHGSMLGVYECYEKVPNKRNLQSWYVDTVGRIHSLSGNDLCVQKKNSADLILGRCNARNKWSNTFEINSLQSTIMWQKNPAKVVGIRIEDSDSLPRTGSIVELQSEEGSQKKTTQEWHLVRSVPSPDNVSVSRIESYIPGKLNVKENGLVLSAGLTSRVIARSGQFVPYIGGSISDERFHREPDGAATFAIYEGPNKGGWILVSNAEVKRKGGGVGAITFNRFGEVIDYEMISRGTSRNCGGGKTYWGTWISCEENGTKGQVWEINPYIGRASIQKTSIGGRGGNYESFAFDNRNRMTPKFFVTNDYGPGGMVRFSPDPNAVFYAEKTGDYSNLLTSKGKHEWLILLPSSGRASATNGVFRWTSSRHEGDQNAQRYYQFSEGIDVKDEKLYFTTKKSRSLYILDLDTMTYERSSTKVGTFDGQPDQIVRLTNIGSESVDMIYFCEDGRSSGIHARDRAGVYRTILEHDGRYKGSETTGLAFSPNNIHMYFALQDVGLIFDITRKDGLVFDANIIDIKYHTWKA